MPEHFTHSRWKGPSVRRSPFAKPSLAALTYRNTHREAGRNHLKALQHLESSCWPVHDTAHSMGPVGMWGGRDKVRKQKRGRGFAGILARSPQIGSPCRSPSGALFLSTGSRSRLLPGGPCSTLQSLPRESKQRGGNTRYCTQH